MSGPVGTSIPRFFQNCRYPSSNCSIQLGLLVFFITFHCSNHIFNQIHLRSIVIHPEIRFNVPNSLLRGMEGGWGVVGAGDAYDESSKRSEPISLKWESDVVADHDVMIKS